MQIGRREKEISRPESEWACLHSWTADTSACSGTNAKPQTQISVEDELRRYHKNSVGQLPPSVSLEEN